MQKCLMIDLATFTKGAIFKKIRFDVSFKIDEKDDV